MKITKEFKIGLFTVIVLCFVYASINFLKGTNLFLFNQKKYSVIYDKGGARIGDGVYIKGIWIGSVYKVKFLKKDFKLKVYFKIRKDVNLTDKCVAILKSPNLMPGRNYISITFSEQGGLPLKPGSQIKGTIDESFANQIMNNAMPLLDDIKSTSALISELAENLANNQMKINSAISNLEFLTSNVKDYVVKNKDFFDDITRNVSNILSVLADDKNGLKPITSELKIMLSKINKLNIHEVNTTAREFRILLNKVQKKGTNLGNILYKEDMYENFNKTLISLEKLLQDIKTSPNRYVQFSIFGKRPVRRKG